MVPQKVSTSSVASREKPKSHILVVVLPFSFTCNIFYGFISRWIMFRECMNMSPEKISNRIWAVSSKVKSPSRFSLWMVDKFPKLQYSITMKIHPSSQIDSKLPSKVRIRRTIFSCSRLYSREISCLRYLLRAGFLRNCFLLVHLTEKYSEVDCWKLFLVTK